MGISCGIDPSPPQALVHTLLPSSPSCVALLVCGVPGSGDVRGCSEVSHSFSPSVLPGSRASHVPLPFLWDFCTEHASFLSRF